MAPFSSVDPLSGTHADLKLRAGTVLLISNIATYEFYIDAAPGFSAGALKSTFQLARRYGLVVEDPGPYAPAILDDDTIRIWLTPTGELADALNPLQ